MVNFQNIQSWIYYVKYLMICFIILSFQLLPMRIVYQEVLWPNLIYLVTVGWLIRKPSYLPVILILFVHIISDIVLLKPLGLWPALSLIGYEFLRWRSLSQGQLKLGQELVLVNSVLILLTFLQIGMELIFKIESPPMGMILLQLAFTLLIYPIVIFVLHSILKVRHFEGSKTVGRGMSMENI